MHPSNKRSSLRNRDKIQKPKRFRQAVARKSVDTKAACNTKNAAFPQYCQPLIMSPPVISIWSNGVRSWRRRCRHLMPGMLTVFWPKIHLLAASCAIPVCLIPQVHRSRQALERIHLSLAPTPGVNAVTGQLEALKVNAAKSLFSPQGDDDSPQQDDDLGCQPLEAESFRTHGFFTSRTLVTSDDESDDNSDDSGLEMLTDDQMRDFLEQDNAGMANR